MLGVICEGVVEQISSTTLECSEAWVMQSIAQEFDPVSLDPHLIAGAVGMGFFMLLPLWVACYGGRQLIKSLSSSSK